MSTNRTSLRHARERKADWFEQAQAHVYEQALDLSDMQAKLDHMLFFWLQALTSSKSFQPCWSPQKRSPGHGCSSLGFSQLFLVRRGLCEENRRLLVRLCSLVADVLCSSARYQSTMNWESGILSACYVEHLVQLFLVIKVICEKFRDYACEQNSLCRSWDRPPLTLSHLFANWSVALRQSFSQSTLARLPNWICFAVYGHSMPERSDRVVCSLRGS